MLLLPIWVLGVWVYRSRWHDNITRRTAALTLIGSCVGWVVVVDGGLAGHIGSLLSNIMGPKLWRVGLGWSRFFLTDYLVAIIVVLNFIAVRAIVARLTITNIPLIRTIRMLSLVTFPLYLFHQPLLLFFASISPSQASDATRSIFVIVSTLVVAGAVTPFCELLRTRMRGFLMYSFEVAKGRWSASPISEARKAG